VRLGEETRRPCPDGNWVLAITHDTPEQLFFVTDQGRRATRDNNDAIDHFTAAWLRMENRWCFRSETRTCPRLYVQDLEGGKPRAITAEGAAASFSSFAGRKFCGRSWRGRERWLSQ